MVEQPYKSLTQSAFDAIYGDLDKQLEFQRELEMQKLKNAPKTAKGFGKDALDSLEGHSNEVTMMLRDAEKLESILDTLPPDQLLSEQGQALVAQYNELTSPSRLNSLKRSYEYSKEAMKDNERHEARDEIVSINGNMYVEDQMQPTPNAITVSRGEFIANRQRYKPLTSSELILLRDKLPSLAGDMQVNAAISSIEGMSRVNTELESSIKNIGKSNVDAEFSKELKNILNAKGKVQSNTQQASKALSYIRSSLSSGMLETLRNQAAMNVNRPEDVDAWVNNLLAEKVASHYDIETDGSSKGDRGVFANIDAGSAALDWKSINLVSSEDKTKKTEVYQTTVPPNQMDVLENIALVKYPGEAQPTNRPLSEIRTPILLADGTQIYSSSVEDAEKIYLTRPTGRVIRVPDPLFKSKHEQYLNDMNTLAKRLNNANEDEKVHIQNQIDYKQKMLNAIPARSYFEYTAIMEAAIASQPLFTEIIDGEEVKVVDGMLKKTPRENNAYGMKEHKGDFYDAKFGGIINYPIEMPIFIRIDNLSYMDNKNDKYTNMLIEEKELQEKANEMNMRMTSRPI